MIEDRVNFEFEVRCPTCGRFVEELKDNTLEWIGSSNQRVIDVQKSLETGRIILYCK